MKFSILDAFLARFAAVMLACMAVYGAPAMADGFHADSRLKVSVGIPPLKYLVERVGGELVHVDVLADGGASPETWEPSARDIASLADTDAYIELRLPFEQSWLTRIGAQHPALKRIDCGGERSSDADPHIWTSPRRASAIAQCLTEALLELRPAKEIELRNNLASLLADLERLDKDIQALVSVSSTHAFLVHHASWAYFASDYQLEQIAIEHDGREPGPRRLAELIEQARARGLKIIFTESQRSAHSTQVIAESLDARIEMIDPLAEDYLVNLRHVARRFLSSADES